jgi:His/Glu/Gln/Arg/opine family amino acid ABC transporter permease subunit
MNIIEIFIQYREAIFRGLFVTFKLCLIIWTIGIVFGSGLGVVGSKLNSSVGRITRWFGFLLSGIPIIVFLFWMHYPLQAMLGVVIDPFITTILTLGIVNIFQVAETVRTAINEMPSEYLLAAKVCGMPKRKVLFKIQFPLIFRKVLPPVLITQVNMLHMTLFASFISVEEIFRIAQQINARIFQPIEIYTAVGILFLAISLPMQGLALLLKKKYTRDISEK